METGTGEARKPAWPGILLKFARSRAATHEPQSAFSSASCGANDATPAARVSAANAILDRGWGKATQPLENSDNGALELIHRIERVIVSPERADSEDA